MTDQWRTNFRYLWGGHFLSVLSAMVIAPMLPFYMNQLGADDPASVLMWSGLALAASPVTAALTAPLWGKLGDGSSRKWMVIRALLGSAFVLAGMGLVQTPFQLFIMRLLQGALGGVVDAVGAFAASEARPQEQGHVRGKLEGALAAGSMLGPLLGGFALATLGFRPLFLLLGALLGLWTLLCLLGLKEARREKTRSAVPRRMTGDLIQLCRERRVFVFLMAGVLANVGMYGLLTVLPVYVGQHAEPSSHSAAWVGVLQAVNWASVWFASSWWGKRNDRLPVSRNYILASGLCGVAILCQAAAPALEWLIPLRVMQGLASSALLQSVFLIVTRSSPPDQLGSRLGFARSILFTGQIAGPIAVGFMGSLLSPPVIFALNGTIIMAGGLFVWLFAEPKNRLASVNLQQNEGKIG
ncbi:MFS transporter [Paenibacillus sp. y28]|uniref:MFS transporter n=1 Tax=Paenibacillus sp. y28 TaxID=3129110 RepID=UPI00301828EB